MDYAMTTATLRRSGGSLIMTVPSVFAEQNHLSPGDSVDVEINGSNMIIQATKKKQVLARLDLKSLVANTESVFLTPVWDDVLPVGQEIW